MDSTGSTSFTPYWRPYRGQWNFPPKSWVFFVVFNDDGSHEPVAVASHLVPQSVDNSAESMGYSITYACDRLIAIFKDKSNHRALNGELALARAYYESKKHGERELPSIARPHKRGYDGVHPFPFIETCLIRGISAHNFRICSEPLDTKFRGSDPRWGMVVIDITDLKALRYGIVGYPSNLHIHIATPKDEERRRCGEWKTPELRFNQNDRPRSAMSGVEYWKMYCHSRNDKVLANFALIDNTAMEIIWPRNPQNRRVPLGSIISTSSIMRRLSNQAMARLSESIFTGEDYCLSCDEVDVISRMKGPLRAAIMQQCGLIATTFLAGMLIKIAFANDDHLDLTRFSMFSSEVLASILQDPCMVQLKSLSLCIGSVSQTPDELADLVSGLVTLEELYLFQSPFAESDRLSVEIFGKLRKRGDFLYRVKTMFAGSYSAGLQDRLWLPLEHTPLPTENVNGAPSSFLPVQQIILLCEYKHTGTESGLVRRYIPLDQTPLTPDRCTVDLLNLLQCVDYFRPIAPALRQFCNPPAFSFNSGKFKTPGISPITPETLPIEPDYSQRQDILPGYWTVIALKSYTRFTKYAIIRSPKHRIGLHTDKITALSPDDIEVLDIEKFMAIVCPSMDLAKVLSDSSSKYFPRTMDRVEVIRYLHVLTEETTGLVEVETDSDALERCKAPWNAVLNDVKSFPDRELFRIGEPAWLCADSRIGEVYTIRCYSRMIN